MLPNVDIIISKTEPLTTEQIKWLSGLKRGFLKENFSFKAPYLQRWWKFDKLRVQELSVCRIPERTIKLSTPWTIHQVDASFGD